MQELAETNTPSLTSTVEGNFIICNVSVIVRYNFVTEVSLGGGGVPL